ncbi:DUF2500 family protein [Agarivorans sp.]|uniref:DUF2500 family protein n=1 Tax=Agarivorans sp. TaxID=1872412 RepID=UPI003D05C4F2
MALIAAMVVYQLWLNVQQRRWDHQQPMHKLWVRVSKLEEQPLTRLTKHNEGHQLRCRYFVEFTPLEGGQARRFAIKRSQYQQLDQHLRGELTIQGSRLIRFEVGEPPSDGTIEG